MSSQIPPPPLNPSLYNLQENELKFFKAQTGIQDSEELKSHMLDVQAEAYKVRPYTCIRRLAFTTYLSIPSMTVLKIGKENPEAILLDLGCCFGNDARKVVADGYPIHNVIAADLKAEFWALGHKLFRSSETSFPVAFIAGNIFDPEFLAPNVPPAASGSVSQPRTPSLASVTSLTQLQHHISVIHISAIFHLFNEAKQCTLAHLLGSLLSPAPGSLIFGSHVGIRDGQEKEEKEDGDKLPIGSSQTVFDHSPSSWKKLWMGEGGVFKPGDVHLSTKVVEVETRDVDQAGGDPTTSKTLLFVFSIMRA